jgi:hypothetical protein
LFSTQAQEKKIRQGEGKRWRRETRQHRGRRRKYKQREEKGKGGREEVPKEEKRREEMKYREEKRRLHKIREKKEEMRQENRKREIEFKNPCNIQFIIKSCLWYFHSLANFNSPLKTFNKAADYHGTREIRIGLHQGIRIYFLYETIDKSLLLSLLKLVCCFI